MNILDLVKQLAINAKEASKKLALTSSKKKNEAFEILKENLQSSLTELLEENKKDINNARAIKMNEALGDQLNCLDQCFKPDPGLPCSAQGRNAFGNKNRSVVARL